MIIMFASMLLLVQDHFESEVRRSEPKVEATGRAEIDNLDMGAPMEKRGEICRAALKFDDWPSKITESVKADPSLGSRDGMIEGCIFYIMGKARSPR